MSSQTIDIDEAANRMEELLQTVEEGRWITITQGGGAQALHLEALFADADLRRRIRQGKMPRRSSRRGGNERRARHLDSGETKLRLPRAPFPYPDRP